MYSFEEKLEFLLSCLEQNSCSSVCLMGPAMAMFSEKEIKYIYQKYGDVTSIRNYLIRRVVNDLRHKSCSHSELIDLVWNEFERLDKHRNQAYFLNMLFEFFSEDEKIRCLSSFLNDRLYLIRKRAYCHINEYMFKIFRRIVEINYEQYGDYEAIDTIINYFDIDYLEIHKQDLFYSTYSLKLLNKLCKESQIELLNSLKYTDVVEYVYLSFNLGYEISEEDVKKALEDHLNHMYSYIVWIAGHKGFLNLLKEISK